MAERMTDIAIKVLMALLTLLSISGVFMIAKGISSDVFSLISVGLRTTFLALAALTIVAALFSNRKRLAAIEAALMDR